VQEVTVRKCGERSKTVGKSWALPGFGFWGDGGRRSPGPSPDLLTVILPRGNDLPTFLVPAVAASMRDIPPRASLKRGQWPENASRAYTLRNSRNCPTISHHICLHPLASCPSTSMSPEATSLSRRVEVRASSSQLQQR
jgi:hypothetical protein